LPTQVALNELHVLPSSIGDIITMDKVFLVISEPYRGRCNRPLAGLKTLSQAKSEGATLAVIDRAAMPDGKARADLRRFGR
jgi:hypothetical protein